MYIKKEDHHYLMGLFNSLDDVRQQRFINQLIKVGSEKVGADITKIKIFDDSIYNVQAIDPSEMITRTMIKKVYRAVKEGK